MQNNEKFSTFELVYYQLNAIFDIGMPIFKMTSRLLAGLGIILGFSVHT